MPSRLFRRVWWLSNALLAVTLVATIWSGVSEFYTRQYLKGFSNAIVPQAASPQQKVEAILSWMSEGPPSLDADHPENLSPRDSEETVNYQHLMEVCGSATNAFLFLSRSAGLEARRLTASAVEVPCQRTNSPFPTPTTRFVS